MHVIATNLVTWISVIIEETIIELSHTKSHNESDSTYNTSRPQFFSGKLYKIEPGTYIKLNGQICYWIFLEFQTTCMRTVNIVWNTLEMVD